MLKVFSIGTSKSIALVVCYMLFGGLKAQELNYSLPLVYSFSFQPLFHNPAAYSENQSEINGNFHSYRGDFSDVNNTYLSGIHNINKQRAIGGLFLHEATSDFFKRSRAYVIYQEAININHDFWIRAGAQLGLINFNMASVGFGPGGSDWNYDAAVAINFGNDVFQGGFILQQLSNAELQPIIYTFTINRYTEVFGKYKFDLSPQITYTPEIRYQQNTNYDLYLLSNTLDYNELAGVNATWNINNGYSILGYYNAYNSDSSNGYRFFMAYFVPLSTSLKNIDAQQYELGVKIELKKKT